LALDLADEDALVELAPDVGVHTTPLGTDGEGRAPVPDALLRPGVHVLDAVYRPRRTELLRRAEARGATPVEGAAWFLHQAWLQHLRLFHGPYEAAFGAEGPPAPLVEAALASMERALGRWLGPAVGGEDGTSGWAGTVALVGLRCSGKTTVGRALAAASGARFVDLDDEVARGAGVPHVATLIERDGLDDFRRREERALREHLEGAAGGGPLVLSTGGGAVESAGSRALLRERARCVWLRAPLDLLRARRAADVANPRPVLAGDSDEDEFTVLDRRRAPLYREVSRLILDVETGAPDDLAAAVERALPL
ncbi:MAG: shikimate kinase, partial [Planctomycetota bacterium]